MEGDIYLTKSKENQLPQNHEIPRQEEARMQPDAIRDKPLENSAVQDQEPIIQPETLEHEPYEYVVPATVVEVRATNLSEPFRKFVKRYKEAVIEENKRVPNPIYVDEIATKVARFYELVRKIIDWKEEHLIRRAAIERILKRRFLSELYDIGILPDIKPEDIAEPFVFELVRSGYFPNGKIAKEKIIEVQKVLEKYIYILKKGPEGKLDVSVEGLSKKEKKAGFKKTLNFYSWVIEIAECEIEELLDPPLREYALLDLMTECLLQRIKIVPEGKVSDEDKYLQTYIEVHRTLFSLNSPIISYHLIKYKYPELFRNTDEHIAEFAEKVMDIWQEIEDDLESPLGSEFHKVAEKYDAAYLMIGDAMNKLSNYLEDMEYKVSDSNTFLGLTSSSYTERLKTLKARLFKLAIFSTLSIFVAGSISLFFVEVPLANFAGKGFSIWATFVDIGLPTLCMFILVWLIKPPSVDNLEIVEEEVSKIVYKSDVTDVYEIKLNKKVRKVRKAVFFIIYMIGGSISCYFIYWVFKICGVPWTSLYIDTVNLAMIIAAAMVIRERAKELTLIEKGNLVDLLVDFFSIPLAKFGSWFNNKWKEYNIASAFFTALIDYPVSTFVAAIEGWREFIQEKRSELH